MLSPSFGGGTANVEFEVLTGLNVYLNKNELLYVSKIKRPIYSLARYFNQLGYTSTAMHNNGKYFYNRSAVYQNLGFQRFISLENMTTNPNSAINQGGWATDDLIYDSVKQQLQSSQQPQFIYAITVENHPMYNDDRFGKDKYIINKTGVSPASQRQLNTYLLGMQRADTKLKQLIEMTKQLDRPTMIVFFGDHLPNLQKVYDDFVKEQAIDAIGAIAHKYDDHSSLDSLINLSGKHEINKIVQWKIIRALSGFKNNNNALKVVINILNRYYSTKMNSYTENTVEIQWEAIRSIGQIGIANNEVNEILNSFKGNENLQFQFALKIARKSLY
jgi:phosphoglycerol transferase MdoB-like AlkP superfamily enzyme